MRFVLYPFSLHCEGAIAIRDCLKSLGQHAFFAKRDGNYIPKPDDFIIGWGCSKQPSWANLANNGGAWINKPNNIHHAVNKLVAMDIMRNFDVPTPKITYAKSVVAQWLATGSTVLARHRIAGKQGEGIEVLQGAGSPVPEAKFYSLVTPSTKEFRAYLLNGKLVDVLEKRRQNGTNDPGVVRTEANGWVFCRQNVDIPAKCVEASAKALAALGLEFGGVDVLWNHATQTAIVLEVNTAPGVFGTGVSKVAEAFISFQKESSNALQSV